jgi:PKHD-type hydroxylase
MKGFAFLHQHLDESIMEKILNIADSQDWIKGQIYNGEVDDTVRSTELIRFDVHRQAWLAGILMYIAKTENANFGFDLGCINQIELVKYTKGGEYVMHQDTDWNKYPYQRKLSMTIQLSNPEDYEGGDFIFRDDNLSQIENIYKDKGSIIIFPSIMQHKIAPVTKGERLALVAWVEGPAWR